MSTRHKNHVPLNKGSRAPKAPPSRRQPVINHAITGRVVVVETIHATEDVIRISIETARAAGQPERIILF